jgi:hypothetical protein
MKTDENGVPKGQMRQPEVQATYRPDSPNSQRHAEKMTQWQCGQRWETLIDGQTIWCPVGDNGYSKPTWDAYQDYRRIEE